MFLVDVVVKCIQTNIYTTIQAYQKCVLSSIRVMGKQHGIE